MKKISLILLAFICFSAATVAQDLEFSAVARLEANPAYYSEDKSWDNDFQNILGNSSIYTFAYGTFAENFTYELTNCWVNTYPKYLYSELGTPLYTWLLTANVGYEGEWFSANLGKVNLPMGTFEQEFDDVYIDCPFSTTSWNLLCTYQWGGTFSVQPWESTSFSFGVTSSPLADKIFSKVSVSLLWEGEYGIYSSRWSIHSFGKEEDGNQFLATLGNKLSFSSSELTFDEYICKDYNEGFVSYLYNINDKFEAQAKVGYFNNSAGTSANIGAAFRWYPLKDSKDLRLHALVNYDSSPLINGLTFSIGAIYNLNFNFNFRK